MRKCDLVVVLGAHRSGTSAITRGLAALGVELGDELIPPSPRDNPKGFWEDVKINALCIDLLKSLESDWDHLSPIDPKKMRALLDTALFDRAVELIRSKTSGAAVFGFKDPRLPRLMDFWQAVFRHCDIRVGYVLALRHPTSVAKSLQKRDELPMEHGYLLWVGHVLGSISGSAGSRRIVVDYDRMLQNPERELDRIARRLGLTGNRTDIDSFCGSFLDSALRHTSYDLNNLVEDSTCPALVRDVYLATLDAARDRCSLDAFSDVERFEALDKRFLSIVQSPYLALSDQLISQRSILIARLAESARLVAEQDSVIVARNKYIAGLESHLVDSNRVSDERLRQIALLSQTASGRDTQIAEISASNTALRASLFGAKRELQANVSKIGALRDESRRLKRDLELTDRCAAEAELKAGSLEMEVRSLAREISPLKGEIGSLKLEANSAVAALRSRDERITDLEKRLSEKDIFVRHVFATLSWRVTSPLRTIRRLVLRARSKSAKELQSSPRWFDPDWYSSQNPDVAMTGIDPYEHYVSIGNAQGRKPAPDGFWARAWGRMRATSRHARNRQEEIPPTDSPDLTREFESSISLDVSPSDAKRLAQTPRSDATHHDQTDYAEWVRRFDTLTDEDRKYLSETARTFALQPLISVVMPVFNPESVWLRQAIESVRSQIYTNWELCIADDASSDPSIRSMLSLYGRADPRIKVTVRQTNGHISAASNSALRLCSGEWVALLDHDDILAEGALFWVADAINRSPGASMIYSDEDKINANGDRCQPHFKSDWNYELFLTYNMVSHLGVFRRSLIQERGGFQIGYEGAQDYDLALRCVEKLERSAIVHIPRVLYHWRQHPESTSSSIASKPYALLAGRRSIDEHLQRTGQSGHAEIQPHGYYRVRFGLPDMRPLVSIIIPTRNSVELIRNCIDSVLSRTSYPHIDLIVVDNGSDDPATLNYLTRAQETSELRVLRDDRPFNYSALNNLAVKTATGEFLAFVNNDVEVLSPDWLDEMISHAHRPGVGAVGARLLYPNESIQHAGVIMGMRTLAGHAHRNLPRAHLGYFARSAVTQELSAVTAACLVIRKSIFVDVGGFDEVNLPVAFNDVDLCLRIRQAGYRNIYAGYAEMYHQESATRGLDNVPEKRARFEREVGFMQDRWKDLIRHDPAYNPNLTLEQEDFSLAWPPRLSHTPHSSEVPSASFAKESFAGDFATSLLPRFSPTAPMERIMPT